MSTLKSLNRHYLGKIVLCRIEQDSPIYRARRRWITGERNGRFYARAPKIGVLIRDLRYKRDADFGPEKILPKDVMIWNR